MNTSLLYGRIKMSKEVKKKVKKIIKKSVDIILMVEYTIKAVAREQRKNKKDLKKLLTRKNRYAIIYKLSLKTTTNEH